MELGPGTPPHIPPVPLPCRKHGGYKLNLSARPRARPHLALPPHTCGESLDMPNPAGEAWEVGGSIDVCILAVI